MIEIQKFKKENIEKLISWIDNAEDLMQFAGPKFTFPLTKSQILESLEDKNRFTFSVKNKDEIIGHAEIYFKENSLALGRILINKENRGKGYGKLLTEKLLDYGFENSEKEFAELNVFDWNIPAIKSYEKAGFIINPNESVQREINGKIWTALNMRIYRQEYKKTCR
ncbi:GNAT family N-acetyltransferase [Riemerella anatipestifer]|uniref:GNAT family N-acetyltransferase n=1 Tax=Riemerella anatipestifer TaxID=34085 RepID=UPI0007ECB25D|nr:GNAT family N-acetyltransferase [Riemerella anatipestifer]AZZ59506.1 GNAT family N-acetyltransferase [Riemerella anatipestifer]MCO7319355.1 GNAT family N-acetyltransferase [Riemerella anatipestifer]MCQ4155652.1 GNAT family N-acetyltransferase [Riemerella anatipestifer]MCQ4181596.1 GNAT family N-acetyltransferase [Riemerella anatipestifer]MCU7542104.1 GNAT family N-acetyltransferase [Riemerella anatipestifer]